MFSIICMLAPTHWTNVVWATKSLRAPRSIEKPLVAAFAGAAEAPSSSRQARPTWASPREACRRWCVRTGCIAPRYDETELDRLQLSRQLSWIRRNDSRGP